MTDDADPAALADATASFLEEFDDGERALETVLEVDSASDTWTFDDVSLDSGTFGELVSRGIVHKVGGEYRIADTDVVSAVLAGEEIETESDDTDLADRIPSFDFGIWTERRALSGLVGALLLVVAMRVTQYRSVFRDGHVVSPGNDPYHYRYWMEELLAESTDPTNIGMVTEMPSGATTSRPLTHAFNWWFATLLGGDQWAADVVAAWLPVIASLALGIVIYALAVVVTRDVRVGIASVVLFAIAPVHAVYTQVGFLEHRPHQYFWLGVTLLALAWLAVDLTRRRELTERKTAVCEHLKSPATWIVAGVLGLSLGISVHLWGGSSLMFGPLAAYVALRAVIDSRNDISPLLANLPLVVGIAIGAVISAWLHTNWGWHEAFVAYTPVMVLGGAIVVLAVGELWRRLEIHSGGLVALEAGVAGLGLFVFRVFRPEDWERARVRADVLFFRESATETMSLFALDQAIIFGPLTQLGVSFYLGVAVLGWAGWIAYRRYEPAWLLLAVYTSFFMMLAAIQVRFAAQFVVPLSVLGGVGFVYVLSTIDLTRRPLPFRTGDGEPRAVEVDGGTDDLSIALPDRRRVAYILGIGLLVCGLSLLYVPGLSGQVSYDDAEYEAMLAVEDHAMETEREYPENFVLSRWGDNRMYNYFVSGESERYAYAQNKYGEFRSDSDPDGWYAQFDGRVGYVVVTDVDGDFPPESAQVRLLDDLGADSDSGNGLAHYQLLTVDEDRSAAVFAVVPGATIEGTGDPGETTTASTEVTVDGESFTYEREVMIGDDAQLAVTVPYGGEYSVGNETVTVNKDDVLEGNQVTVDG